MPKQDKQKSAQDVAYNLDHAHFGDYDPSEQVDKKKTAKQSQTSGSRARTAEKKKRELDPTGHEGSYNPSDSK